MSSFPKIKSGILLVEYGAVKAEPPSESRSVVLASRTGRVFLAGSGFFADAYDLFVINLVRHPQVFDVPELTARLSQVMRLLREEYPAYSANGSVVNYESSLASSALFSSVVGQILGGVLADKFGRKAIFVATAFLIMISSVGSMCAFDAPHFSIYTQLISWRFVLGLGNRSFAVVM